MTSSHLYGCALASILRFLERDFTGFSLGPAFLSGVLARARLLPLRDVAVDPFPDTGQLLCGLTTRRLLPGSCNRAASLIPKSFSAKFGFLASPE